MKNLINTINTINNNNKEDKKMVLENNDLTTLLMSGIIKNSYDYNLFADNATSEVFDSTILEFVDLRICLNEDGSKFAEIYVPKDGEDVKQNIRFYRDGEECDNYNNLLECWN